MTHLFITLGLSIICLVGLYFTFRPMPLRMRKKELEEVNNPDQASNNIATSAKSAKVTAPLTITSHDLAAIAGDDVMTTQLDLARAYIETGRKLLAKKILEHVVEQGNEAQQDEARTLLGLL